MTYRSRYVCVEGSAFSHTERGVSCWVHHVQAGPSLPKRYYAPNNVGHAHLPLPLLYSAVQSSDMDHHLVGSGGANSIDLIRVTPIGQELKRVEEEGRESRWVEGVGGVKRRGEEKRSCYTLDGLC